MCGTRDQRMEHIIMRNCAILVIPSKFIFTIIIIMVLLFPFQERKHSDLWHFANVEMQYVITAMPEECSNLSAVTSVWVSDACSKPYNQPRNFNKTVTVSDGCA